MTTTLQPPANPAAMLELRRKWEDELAMLRRDLRAAIKEGDRIASESTRNGYLRHELKAKIDQREANLAKYRA